MLMSTKKDESDLAARHMVVYMWGFYFILNCIINDPVYIFPPLGVLSVELPRQVCEESCH